MCGLDFGTGLLFFLSTLVQNVAFRLASTLCRYLQGRGTQNTVTVCVCKQRIQKYWHSDACENPQPVFRGVFRPVVGFWCVLTSPGRVGLPVSIVPPLVACAKFVYT